MPFAGGCTQWTPCSMRPWHRASTGRSQAAWVVVEPTLCMHACMHILFAFNMTCCTLTLGDRLHIVHLEHTCHVASHHNLLPCRTFDPEEADFFYVPAYTSCYPFPIMGWADFPWFGPPGSGLRVNHAAMLLVEVSSPEDAWPHMDGQHSLMARLTWKQQKAWAWEWGWQWAHG